MADQKISQLPTITGANMADNDKFVLVDTSGDATVATTRAEFFKSVPDVTFGVNDKAIFGAGSDLQIFHNGSNSFVQDTGTGNLYLAGSNSVLISNASASETMATFNLNSSVNLYYDNAIKLATTATGIDVDGLTVDKAGSSAALFKGYSSVTDVSSASNGEITLGNNDSFRGIISYDGQADGVLYIENSYNNNAADIVFRSKSSGTAQNKLKLDGNGDINFYEATGTTPKLTWDASAESLDLTGAGGLDVNTATGSVNIQAGNASADIALGIGSPSSANKVVVTAGGNVGIGTDSPDSVLHLQKTDATAYSSTATDGQVGVGPTIYLENPANSNGTVGGQIVFGMRSTEEQARISATGGTAPSLVFGTGDAERMRVDDSGKLLIGTTHNSLYNSSTQSHAGVLIDGANDNLQVAKWQGSPLFLNRMSTEGTIVDLRRDGATVGAIGTRTQDSQTNFFIGFDQASADVGLGFGHASGTGRAYYPCRVDGSGVSGAISLGTSNYKYKDLHLSGIVGVGDGLSVPSAYGGKIVSYQTAGATSSAVACINSATTGTARQIDFFRGASTARIGSIESTTSSVSYNTSSDYRLKTDAQPMTGASARVQALNPVNFEWISDGTRVDGFLAHEAQAVVPESVSGTKDAMRDEEYEVTPAVLDDDGNVTTEAVMGTRSVPDYQGIDQSKIVPLLTAALQEALTEIASLKTRVEALEG